MNGINISENKIGQIILTFPDDPLLVAKAKTFPDYRWQHIEKLCSFPTTDGTLESSIDLMKIKNPLDQILGTKRGGGV
jgi:hypothetical protein